MKGRDFIITCNQLWETETGTTIKNLALEISKQNNVLYVNTPIDYSSCLRNIKYHVKDHRMDVVKKKNPPLRKIRENLWVLDLPHIAYSINKIPFNAVFDFFNKLNNKMIAKNILKYADILNFNDYILFIDNDIYRSLYMKEFLSPHLTIYYRRDYVIGQSYWKRHGTRLEPEIIAKADITMGNSTLFCEELKKYNLNVFLLETGVDLSLYDSGKEYQTPVDIKDISHPIVGYTGAIDSTRLDEKLMCQIAEKRPGYSFILTGTEDELFKNSLLHKMNNVFFTGSRKVEDLSSYITAFDVCINPQKINEITQGNYPLKIDEYLALGKPIVATATKFMIEVFKEHVHLANNADEYLKMIDLGIEESKDVILKGERIKFAHTHSWENRVNKLYEVLTDKGF